MPTTSSIGVFDFIQLEGQPYGAHEEVEVIQRPGVDGVSIWKTGTRGRPFQMTSFVDQATLDKAQELMALYRAAVGGDPVRLVWENRFFGEVSILNVEQVRARKLGGSVGGVDGGGALLVAQWTLIVVSG